MKEIKAFIRPDMLDAVLHAPHEHPDLPAVTVSEVRGFEKVVGQDLAAAPGFDATKTAKLECIVEDAMAAGVIEIIRAHANTGRFGDGKIVTLPIDSVLRVRMVDSREWGERRPRRTMHRSRNGGELARCASRRIGLPGIIAC